MGIVSSLGSGFSSLESSAKSGLKSTFSSITQGIASSLSVNSNQGGSYSRGKIPQFSPTNQSKYNPNYTLLISSSKKNLYTGSSTTFILANLQDTIQFATDSKYSSPFAQLLQGSALQEVMGVMGYYPVTQFLTLQEYMGTSFITMDIPLTLYADTDAKKDVQEVLYDLHSLVLPSINGQYGGVFESPGPSFTPAGIKKGFEAIYNAIVNSTDSPVTPLSGASILTNSSFQSPSIPTHINTVIAKLSNISVPKTLSAVSKASQSISNNLSSYMQNLVSITIGQNLTFEYVVINSVSQSSPTLFDSNGYPIKAEVKINFTTMLVPTVEDLPTILNLTKTKKASTGLSPFAGAALQNFQTTSGFVPGNISNTSLPISKLNINAANAFAPKSQ